MVGLGSVCRRQATAEIDFITDELAGLGLRLHGFGVKALGLRQYADRHVSADSLAWSLRGPPQAGLHSQPQDRRQLLAVCRRLARTDPRCSPGPPSTNVERGHEDGGTTTWMAIEAEQALLGAVLSYPSGQAHALDHVNPGDFVRPYHRQVFDAMQRIRARGEVPGPHEVRAELRADPDMPEHVHDQPWLITDLMHEAPRSGHAVAYAGLVAENGIRQGLDISGMRMVQAAELDNDSALEVALRLSADARRELNMAQARWAALRPGAQGDCGSSTRAARTRCHRPAGPGRRRRNRAPARNLGPRQAPVSKNGSPPSPST